MRIRSLDGAPTERLTATESDPIVSDTHELAWYASAGKNGLVTVDTDRTEALVGFLRANNKALHNLAADITNNFATIVLSSLDGQPLARSSKMLLTTGSRVANTAMKWNEAHTRVVEQGCSPSLIEPVAGKVTLRNIEKAADVRVDALDGAGKPIGEPIEAKETADGWVFPVGAPVTTWYVVSVRRR